MKQDVKFNSVGSCEICGSWETKIYETEDGAKYVACCQSHFKQAIINEEKTAKRELRRALARIMQTAQA